MLKAIGRSAKNKVGTVKFLQILKKKKEGEKSGRLGFVIRLSLSAALIAAVLLFVNFGELVGILAKANPWFLVAGPADYDWLALLADRE